MTVREFFEKIEPLMELHTLFNSLCIKKLNIKIWDGGGAYGNRFCANGVIDTSSRLSIFDFTRPFENTYFGKEVNKELKTISVFNMKIKEWEIKELEDEDDFVLIIEVDTNIR